jgi:hypothetical protein
MHRYSIFELNVDIPIAFRLLLGTFVHLKIGYRLELLYFFLFLTLELLLTLVDVLLLFIFGLFN